MIGTCLFALAVLSFIIGLVQLFAPEKGQGGGFPFPLPGTGAGSAGQSGGFPPAGQPQPFPGPAQPASAPQAPVGTTSVPHANFAWVQPNQRIRLTHPTQGELTLYVMGRADFQELWQQQRSPQAPWVPTGTTFQGFWLENNLFLLGWQNRAYLLEERVALSDAEIQRDFAPFAREFAQSDQRADVYFAYPPASWHIDDIGKFRIANITGEGFPQRPGAVGRFVHASGEGQRALVLEDYEGGGQDTVWIGYQIQPGDVAQA